jgi:hypothetical protein
MTQGENLLDNDCPYCLLRREIIAELIRHNARCGTSMQKRPPESGHGVEISVIPERSVSME